MERPSLASLVGALALLVGGPCLLDARTPTPGTDLAVGSSHTGVKTTAMWFEPTADGAGFVGRSGDAQVELDARGAHFDLAGTTLGLTVVGGRPVAPRVEKPLATRVNYFHGADRSRWRSNVPTFGRVVYPGVREGVDFVFHGEEGQLEYDFVVHPGGDPAAVALGVSGAGTLATNDRGELVMHTERGDIVQPRPRVYQHGADGVETEVAAAYRVTGHSQVAFELADYDRSRDLVIDPIVTFATAFAGGGAEPEGALGVVAAPDGSLFVSGGAGNPDPSASHPWADAYVRKFAADGTTVIWATYFGGTATEYATALTLDDTGAIYVAGTTRSSDFPSTSSAVPSFSVQGRDLGPRDAFVAKLDVDGVLDHAMLLAGSADDVARGVAVDAQHAVYVVGSTRSADFSTSSPLRSVHGGNDDAFVAKVDATFSSLVFSTFLGGSENDDGAAIAIDPAGRVVVAGTTWSPDFPTALAMQTTMRGRADAFVAWLSADGSSLERSTLLGGSGYDNAVGIALDSAGAVYVAGSTDSMDFPIVHAAQAKQRGREDAYVTKLAPGGASIVYSTFLGGSESDLVRAIAVAPNGVATIVGSTRSKDLPLVEPIYPALPGGGMKVAAEKFWSAAGFIASVSPDGASFPFVSYHVLGAPAVASGVAVGAARELFVTAFGSRTAMTTSLYPYPYGWSYTVSRIDPSTAKLAPAVTTVAPAGRVTFATEGLRAPFSFSLAQNASGGSIDPATGAYVAGKSGSCVDIVRAVDADGVAATASVVIGVPVTLTKSQNDVGARASISLSAKGGYGQYTWRVVSAPSGGHLVSTSGTQVDYVAGDIAGTGPTSNIVDEIEVEDGYGSTARVKLPVRALVLFGPASTWGMHPGQTSPLYTLGGGKSRTWSFDLPSGGTVEANGTSGTYRAGTKGYTTDRITVVDELGNTAELVIQTGPSVTVSPSHKSVSPGQRISFVGKNAISGGTWKVISTGGGSFITPEGEYVAGKIGEDTVVLVDGYGVKATATVTVTDSPPVDDGDRTWTDFHSTPADEPPPPPSPAVEEPSGCSTSGRPTSSRAMLASVLALALVAWRRRRGR